MNHDIETYNMIKRLQGQADHNMTPDHIRKLFYRQINMITKQATSYAM